MATRKDLRNEFERDNSYKDTTIKSYVNSIFNVAKRFGHDNLPLGKVSDWFDYDQFFLLFEEVRAMTRRNYISSIIALLKLRKEESDPLFDKLSEHRDNLTSEYERIVEKGELTISEKERWVDFENLRNIYSEIKTFLERIGFFTKGKKTISSKGYDPKEIKKIRDAVFIAIYTYGFHDQESNFGVLRNDLTSLYLFNGKKKDFPNDEKNYFKYSRGRGDLIMRQYKTSKKYGELFIKLPVDLTTILYKWAEFSGVKSGEKLFPGCERHYITNSLQSFFLKRVGKPLGTTMLRKIYITGRFGDQHHNQKETAKNMMHSHDVSQNIYSKKV